MSAKKGAFLNYTEEAMRSAVKDVQLHKTPIRTTHPIKTQASEWSSTDAKYGHLLVF